MKRYSLDELQTRLDFEKGSYGKNYIINGGFDYWNYATSQTTSGYGSDNRWLNSNTGSTKSHSQVASGDTERALFNSHYFSRTVVASVAGAGNQVSKWQAIENVTKLAGKTVTISFWAKADTTKNISIEFIQTFGTGGTPSASITGIASQLVQITSSWQKKTITVTIPSIVGKTLGTDGIHTSTTVLDFWFDAGSNFATRTANLVQQSGTFDIAEVKLEEGSVATPWTPYEGEFGGEVQACQRYLPELLSPYDGNIVTFSSSTVAYCKFKTDVKTRVPITGIYISALTDITLYGITSTNSFSSIVFQIGGYRYCGITITASASVGTANADSGTIIGNSTAKILGLGCEL